MLASSSPRSTAATPVRGAERRWQGALTAGFALCLFAVVFGAKLAIVDRFGSDMPDWDQWDAEALHLFVPWFESERFLENLFRPHNEHRIVITKLQNLALALLSGQWDARLECVSNAIVHSAFAVACWLAFRRWFAARWQLLLFVASAALFGLPLAWQNTLGGFHSQQYWLIALSFAAIVALPFARAWSLGWWLAIAAAGLALITMGSGLLAAGMVLSIVLLRLARREMSMREAWPTLAVAALLFAVGALTRVEVGHHQHLKPKTVHDFVFSCLHSLQWPLRDRDGAGALLWLPWALVSWRTLCTRQSALSRGGLTLFGLGAWVIVQVLATAYARGAGAHYPAARYMDTLALGSLVNVVALVWLLSIAPTNRLGRFARGFHYVLGAAWLIAFGAGVRDTLDRHVRHELPDTKKYYAKAEAHMRGYLATNDPAHLAHGDIPFPSAEGLIQRLNYPCIRALMPVVMREPLPLSSTESAAFLENHVTRFESEPLPRQGISLPTPPLLAHKTWGSFTAGGAAATAEWTSAPITAPMGGWLKFETAGQIGESGVSLELRDAKSGKTLAKVAPTKVPHDSWRAAYVRAPREPFVVFAQDASESRWLAFSAPVEMSSLSYWAWRLTKHGLLLVYVGVAASVLLGISALLVRRRSRA